MKKIVLAFCLILALVLVGCGQTASESTTTEATTQETTVPEHDHVLTEWSADATSHWYVCECGEKAELGEHSNDLLGICKVCGLSVMDNGDGSYGIYEYDENGGLAAITEYDADGNAVYAWYCETEYDENDNPKSMKEYEDGVLTVESLFLPCEDTTFSEVYMSESITYNGDGTKEVSTYNEDFNLLTVTEYDADGNAVNTERYEYEYDEEGNCTKQTTYVNDVVNREIFYTVDEYGLSYESKYIYYDENGKVTEEINYDEMGNELA